LLKGLKEYEKVYLWYVAVKGAKMAVVLGSEDLVVPGNTDKYPQTCCHPYLLLT
jgi:hypothetical protein